MRRGRSWRGDARGGRYRGGGGAGYNPRGFLSSGPPRLNRPPWPRQIPALFPQFGPGPPGPPGPPEHFNEEGGSNYGQRTIHRSPQKFFPHPSFQRGNSQKFQRGGRTDYQHNHTQNFEGPPDFTKAPPNFQPRQNFPPNFQQSKQAPHAASNFERKSNDHERSSPDFPRERPDFQKERDFNKPQQDNQNLTNFQKRLIELPNRQSHDFDEDPQTFEQVPQTFERGPQNLPRGRSNFQDDDYDDEQQGDPNHITFQTCSQNFQNRPNFSFKSGPPEFNQRPPNRYSLDHRVQVDRSKPPPPLLQNPYSQDYDYQRPERRESTDLEGSKNAARTPNPYSQDYDYQRPERRESTDLEGSRNTARTPAHTLPHEHSGQRPPATDHYIVDRGVAADDGFHKSIGDTVDIIKKRLLDRRDNTAQQQESNLDTDPKSWSESDSPDKRERSHRRRRSHKESTHQRTKSEKKCQKMKKKIVRELFKMDKETLHKLVDDPNSSAKFEYALNSLIKESRNSLNRQMRAAAEKSLYGSTSWPEHGNKEDTVYEDTFMVQMQGVLDPRDIVMLNDIKPMVMAEINKVLQLDEYGQTYSEEDEKYHKGRSHRDSYDSEPKERDYYDEVFEVPLDAKRHAPINLDDDSEEGVYVSDKEEKSSLPEPHKSRHRSRDSRSVEPIFSEEDTSPKFPGNVESISDDEYPFAELDKQYHVAVEYSMLDQADRSPIPESAPPVLDNLIQENQNKTTEEPATHPSIISVPPSDVNLDLRRTDVHETILKIANEENDKITSNPIKIETERLVKNESIEKESRKSISEKQKPTENKAPKNPVLESKPEIKCIKKETVSSNESKDSAKVNVLKTPNKIQDIKMESGDKSSKKSATRKRETDDKVSHRKEKRKKCDESGKSETNKKVLNKNIIINVNDCASKNSETCETGAKSVFNLFFSKQSAGELHNDSEGTDAVNISYSDKYVKRKPSTDKVDKDNKKTENKKVSSTPTKPANKDNTHSASQSLKAENKVKLQPIDMFEQTPRKPATHSAHRNTTINSPDSKTSGDSTVKTPAPIIVKRGNFKMFKKPITVTNSTQTLLKVHSRCTQTKNLSEKKMVSTSCQTDFPVEKRKDVKKVKKVEVMERMKEIDLEIQELLQEKFGLYKNLGIDVPVEKNIPSLGISIVNIDSNNTDESGMLDTFTKMSEEELQEIATQGFSDTSSLLETESLPSPKKKIKKSPLAKRNVKEQKKKKNIPKVVLKLNKSSLSSPDGSESLEEYKVVKSPKKQKKVTFHDEVCEPMEVIHRKCYKSGLSLLERIMNDDKEFDLLEDEEEIVPIEKVPLKKPVKVTFAAKKKGRAKKKVTHNLKSTVRDCSIVLSRMVLNPSLLAQLSATTFEDEVEVDDGRVEDSSDMKETVQLEDLTFDDDELMIQDDELPSFSGIQLQDDMLDVSEDIVIDGNCDIDKSMESFERAATSECDVVDNGTSREDAASEAPIEGCKLYDYSVNGGLGTEMVAVYGHSDAVVAVECVNDNFLAASTDGSVYLYDGREGTLLATLRGSNFPLTCLTVVQDKYGTTVYTGSLDSRIRCFDLETCIERGPECNVLSPIQSMDRAWDTIFVGTRTGFVLQFECKNNLLIPVSSLKFSEQAILALRALKEGPRKVLLIASRSDQVTIKDAQTGLLLRTLEGPKMTVYCLLFEDGKVFCGTSTNHIQVFDFTNGASVGTHNGGKGVVCLRAAGGLLLAGCYDGCVYVYRSGGSDPIAQLRGPSTMLLSLAVIHSKIVASYKDKSLFMWKIPVNILNEMVL